jgi:hypothetical protein
VPVKVDVLNKVGDRDAVHEDEIVEEYVAQERSV